MTFIIFFTILLFFFWFNPRTDYWYSKWWLLSMIVNLVLSWKIYESANIYFSLLFLLLASSSSWYALYPFTSHYCEPKIRPRSILMEPCAHSLLALYMAATIFILSTTLVVNMFFEAVPFVLIIASISSILARPKIFTCVDGTTKAVTTHGFTGNPSVNATFLSFLAAASFISPHWWSYIGIVLSLIAIVRTKAASGLAGLILVFIIHAIYALPSLLLALPLCALVLILINKKYCRSRLFSLSGRAELLKDATFLFYRKGLLLFGSGVGTFKLLFPLAQRNKKISDKMLTSKSSVNYFALHNDIAQLFFEGGIVSIILAAFAIGSVLFTNIHSPAIVGFIACYLWASLTNFPNHTADTALISILVLRACI